MDPYMIKQIAMFLTFVIPPLIAFFLITFPRPSDTQNTIMVKISATFIISMSLFFGIYFNFPEADEPQILKETRELYKKYDIDFDELSEIKPKIKDNVKYVEKKIETNGNTEPIQEKTPKIENSEPILSKEELQSQINELSYGLVVNYDDMLGITYYQCPYRKLFKQVEVLPYVAVTSDYQAFLFDYIGFTGKDEWTHFNTIYIKSTDKLYQIFYNPYDRYSDIKIKKYTSSHLEEHYNQYMSYEMYIALKESASTGYIRIRIEGAEIKKERELEATEIANIQKVIQIYDLCAEYNKTAGQ